MGLMRIKLLKRGDGVIQYKMVGKLCVDDPANPHRECRLSF